MRLKKAQKYTKSSRRKSNQAVEWLRASDIDNRIKNLTKTLSIDWVNTKNVYCIRSKNTKTRAYARIWGLSRIWQLTLKKDPSYIIEVVSERFDKLPEEEKDKVLLHEIAHIPKNFSGSLVPHYRRGKRKFKNKVDILVAQYNKRKK
jgi:predicted metallopeptidase